MFINHIHLFPREIRANASLEAFLSSIPAAIAAMGHEFEGGVCFAPFSYQFSKLTDNHNTWLHDTIAPHPNLIGYGTLDPGKPAGPQVDHIVSLGFRGVKLHPPAQKFELFGTWAREAYAAMEEHGLVADFHVGMHWHRLKDYDPLLCDEIAVHYPRLRMVYEHVGGWHYYRQVLAVISNNSRRGNHLYAGIASVLDRENQRYWWLGPDGLNDCRWQIGPDLLIYGLDYPYNQARQITNDLAQIAALDWPECDIAGLLGGNLKALLGLSATASAPRVMGGDPNSVSQKNPHAESKEAIGAMTGV